MGSLNIIRIFVQIFATIITLIGIGFAIAALFSSGWQIMAEFGTGEIHQHGLWFDYARVRPHLAGTYMDGYGYNGMNSMNGPLGSMGSMGYAYPGAGYGNGIGSVERNGYSGLGGLNPNSYYGYGYDDYAPGFQWIFSYKFGSAVYGDAVHMAQPYQINMLALLVSAIVVAVVGLFLSYCASLKLGFSIAWSVCLFLAVLFLGAGLGQFYVTAMQPEYRFTYTDRKMQQVVGYAYWWTVIGVIAFALGMILAIIVAVLVYLIHRRGEKPEPITYTWNRSRSPDREQVITVHRGSRTPV